MQVNLDIKKLGEEGEAIGGDFLEKNGFQVRDRNYRCRLGEVDIIAEKGEVIHFVEVKTRRSTDTVSPLELISRSKQVHISKVAQNYLAAKKLQERSAIFDLLVVDWSRSQPECELIEDAFPLAWGY